MTTNQSELDLKAERVQQELAQNTATARPEPPQPKKKSPPRPAEALRATGIMTPAQAQQRLKAERVQLRLKQMPSWRTQPGGRVIDRVRQFPDALTAASYLAFAALLARQSGQRLTASVLGNTITVTLPGRAKGITEEILDLAEQLG